MSSFRNRVANLLVACVFLATVSGVASASHACPHHDGLATGAALEGHAGQMDHAAHNSADPESDESHDAPCSCLGQCSVSTGFVVVGPQVAVQLRHRILFTTLRTAHATVQFRGPTSYLIPFATAPPA